MSSRDESPTRRVCVAENIGADADATERGEKDVNVCVGAEPDEAERREDDMILYVDARGVRAVCALLGTGSKATGGPAWLTGASGITIVTLTGGLAD